MADILHEYDNKEAIIKILMTCIVSIVYKLVL